METAVSKEVRESLAKKATYVGAGIGLVCFAIFGLLPGSLFGSVLGLKLARLIYGTPVIVGVIPRVIVGLSMLVGVMLACLVFVLGCSFVGWLIGTAVDTARGYKKPAEENP